MIEAPVAKGVLVSSSVGGTLLGAALIGGAAYYLFKRYKKKSDEQTVEGEIIEKSQEAADAAKDALDEAVPA